MKKFLPLVLLSLFILNSSLVFADYQSAYNDYAGSYSQYRTAHNDYEVAKSAYQTYKTLTAQTDAIKKLRSVLTARNRVVQSFYNLLEEKDAAGKIKEDEKTWLSTHQKKIGAAANLADLNAVSLEFEEHYPQIEREFKQTVSLILIAKETALKNQIDSFIANLSVKTKEMAETGEDTTFADRGLVNTKVKLDLYQTKIEETNTLLAKPEIDLFAVQKKLQEANRLLHEATSFLSEIIKSITG
jgi:hypothetical protein